MAMAATSRLIEGLVSWIEPADNPAGAAYGAVAVGLLLAAEDPTHETYPTLVVATLITVVLYWLVHSYAFSLSHRLTTGERWSTELLRRSVWHERSVVKGAAAPLVVLLAEWVLGVQLVTAVSGAIWTAAITILALELVAGIRAGLRGRALAGDALLGVVLGGALIAIKLLLH